MPEPMAAPIKRLPGRTWISRFQWLQSGFRMGECDEAWLVHFKRTTFICWAILLIVVSARLATQKNINHTVYHIYAMAGASWIAGTDYYDNQDQLFRYSPPAAAFFAPWSLLPRAVGEIAWRLFGAGMLIGSLYFWMRSALPGFDEKRRTLVVLGSLPLAVASINNGQINIHVLALLLFAAGCFSRGQWWCSAGLVAAAVLFKLWPVALAGLLIACRPRTFGLRFAAAMALGLGAAFLCQRPEYVAEMYRVWLSYLPTDTRTSTDPSFGNRDAWLLVRLMGDPISLELYRVIQLAVAGAMAALIVVMRNRGAKDRVLSLAALYWSVCWMLPFGPATESCTYSLIAPLLAWAFFDPDRRTETVLERSLLYAALVLLSTPLIGNLTPYSRWVESFGIQPMGVCLLLLRSLVSGRPFRGLEPRQVPPETSRFHSSRATVQTNPA